MTIFRGLKPASWCSKKHRIGCSTVSKDVFLLPIARPTMVKIFGGLWTNRSTLPSAAPASLSQVRSPSKSTAHGFSLRSRPRIVVREVSHRKLMETRGDFGWNPQQCSLVRGLGASGPRLRYDPVWPSWHGDCSPILNKPLRGRGMLPNKKGDCTVGAFPKHFLDELNLYNLYNMIVAGWAGWCCLMISFGYCMVI